MSPFVAHRSDDEWAENRWGAIQRDGQECQDCGADVGPRSYPGVMEWAVHHIVPLEEGGTHRLSNLVTLCADCHRERHRSENA